MKFNILPLAALACALAVTACATPTPTRVHLAETTRERIASTEVVAPIRQNEIIVFVPPSTAGASAGASFGLIGALVGAATDASINAQRTSSAERDVKPLRDALVDFDFDGQFKSDLKGQLAQVGWLKVSDVRVAKELNADSLHNAIGASKDPAVLMAVTTYELSNDGSLLTVKVVADLFPNSEELRALRPGKGNAKMKYAAENALYRNTFIYSAAVPPAADGVATDRAGNIGRWSANDAAALREALTKGSAELATLLAADIQAGPETAPPVEVASRSSK